MTRIPAHSARELVAISERVGYQRARQSGSHLILKHPTRARVVVPMHAGDLKRPLMLKIIEGAGFTEDEFLSLV